MIKALIKFVAIITVAAMVAFLSACNGGGTDLPSEGGESQLSKQIRFGEIATIPLTHGVAGNYIIEIQNEDTQKYVVKNMRFIDPLTGQENLAVANVAANSCQSVFANSSCSVTFKPLLTKSGNFILEASLIGEDKKPQIIRQIIRVSDKIISSNGIAFSNDVPVIVINNSRYSLSIPITLTENFDFIKAGSGSLICNEGYKKNSNCSYILSGTTQENDLIIEPKLTGYKANQIVNVSSNITRVTKSINANILLSQPSDILITTIAENNRTAITIFNSGNYTAANIEWEVISGSIKVIDSLMLRSHAGSFKFGMLLFN